MARIIADGYKTWNKRVDISNQSHFKCSFGTFYFILSFSRSIFLFRFFFSVVICFSVISGAHSPENNADCELRVCQFVIWVHECWLEN